MLSVLDAPGKHGCIGLVDQAARLCSSPVIPGLWDDGLVVYGSVILSRKLCVVVLLRKFL